MGETEGREKTDEAGGSGGSAAGSLSGSLEGRPVAFSETKKKSVFREYAEALLIAVLLALLIRTFLVQAFKIPSGSMLQTLNIGDHILVSKFSYGIKVPFTDYVLIPVDTPERGDIIVFKYPKDESKDFIKRVIGLPGEEVQIRNKQVYVNGRPFEDDYGIHGDPETYSRDVQPRDNFGPVTVPSESYFVMGDNRDHSMDSRYWGFVHLNKIKGKAFLVYWSWNKDCALGSDCSWIRWNRIAKRIR